MHPVMSMAALQGNTDPHDHQTAAHEWFHCDAHHTNSLYTAKPAYSMRFLQKHG